MRAEDAKPADSGAPLAGRSGHPPDDPRPAAPVAAPDVPAPESRAAEPSVRAAAAPETTASEPAARTPPAREVKRAAAADAARPAAPVTPEGAAAVPVPRKRRGLRFLLMVLVPLAAAGGGWLYLQGGRYVSTDNSAVGAEKVLITPEVSGRVIDIKVTEGQTLKPGDPLLTIDPEPYRIALASAQAQLDRVKTEFQAAKGDLQSLERQISLQREAIALRQAEVDRKQSLLASRVTSPNDVEASRILLSDSRGKLEQLVQAATSIRNKLSGDDNLPIGRYAPYLEADAAVAKARRDLDATVLRSPIGGVATQVSAIQMGRYLAAGTAIFAVVDTEHPWIDANPKETDLTYVRPGQPVEIVVDAFPDQPLHGVVESISPGTGAQFSVLPAQNASGNWVKVVQRVPTRIALDPGQASGKLRAGMSASVSIDTGRVRTLETVLGFDPRTLAPDWAKAAYAHAAAPQR
jgi:membrane fusion protein (multidrug efflux system)